MKKRWIWFMMVALLFVLLPVMGSYVMAEAQPLTVHYRRFDQNYDQWNLWIWAKGTEGKAYNFSGTDDFGAYAQVTLEDLKGAEEIGIIVRKGEWEAKDIDADRFIDVSKKDGSGAIHVYLVQGTADLYYDIGEIDLAPKFMKAEFLDEKTIRIVTSMPLAKGDIRSQLKVVGKSGRVPALVPSGVSASGEQAQEFVIVLSEAAQIGEGYETSFPDYKPLAVSATGLYDTQSFEAAYGYTGDLGALYTKDKTTFRVWSPTAQAMTLNLYEKGDGGQAYSQIPMKAGERGTWEAQVAGDLQGVYYTFSIQQQGQSPSSALETYDPYALSAGVNGDRSMVVNFEALKPEGWDTPFLRKYPNPNDAIIYEMHIRDLTQHGTSNVAQKGKFIGVVAPGGRTEGGQATGLDHLKDLGITHVQILPMFDFNSIDEGRLSDGVFNWGYDPKNYSVPEGSYSTDPYDGRVRVKEMREMVMGLHQAGIGVIMDVVYNHTALSGDSNLSKLVPNYYYRMENGAYSNGSGTGNETASERVMVRKLMIDSLKNWVKFYDIDGFRFDLMGLHDIETMKMIEVELRALKPDIILYGEGWTGGASALAESERLVKANLKTTPGIGAFNDDFRDAIKGHVFEAEAGGFVSGTQGFLESLKFGFVAAGDHHQVQYGDVNYSKKPWTVNPSQSINYVSAHDNLTLWDKLAVASPNVDEKGREAMQRLANAMVLTSPGVPFLHAGVDFLRTKGGDHNSYKSPDSVNAIDWSLKDKNGATFQYYQGLIALRKGHPLLSLDSQEALQKQLVFFNMESGSPIQLRDQMVGFMVGPSAAGEAGGASGASGASLADGDETLILIFNGNLDAQEIDLPRGHYEVLVDEERASATGFATLEGGPVEISGSSALVLKAGPGWFADPTSAKIVEAELDGGEPGLWYFYPLVVVSGILILGALVISRKHKE